MTEEQLQSQCFQWFWNEFPEERRMLFHIDNNSWNEVIGSKKKALGVCAGVSDMIYILPWGKVAFLECKIPGGIQSDLQKDFDQKVTDREHLYLVFFSLEEFKDIINSLQNG